MQLKLFKRILGLILTLFLLLLTISYFGTNIIIREKFKLKANNLNEIEKLTSKVFQFTNHGGPLWIDHNKIISGLPFLPFTNLDTKITSNYFFYQTIINYLKLDGYLCAGHSSYLKKILISQKIKSFTYNFGDNDKKVSHAVVIAEVSDKLYFFDPTYNVVFKSGNKYLTFKDVLEILSNNENLEKYVHKINTLSKVFHFENRKLKNYSEDALIKLFDRYKQIGNKDHMLMSGLGMYSSPKITMDYFYKKYPYLYKLKK